MVVELAKKQVKSYPLNNENDKGVPMSDTDFTRHSEQIMKDVYYKQILNVNDAYTSNENADQVLENVKKSISNGHRVVFGTLLDVLGKLESNNGATVRYKSQQNIDTWVVTDQVRKDAQNLDQINAGHAMVIIGYDDNAQVGNDKGVLILRNSWSADAGNNGEYYMSYEYFKLFAMEVYEISPTPVN